MSKKLKGDDKTSPSTSNVTRKKSPRGLMSKPTVQGEEEYNEDGEDMDTK